MFAVTNNIRKFPFILESVFREKSMFTITELEVTTLYFSINVSRILTSFQSHAADSPALFGSMVMVNRKPLNSWLKYSTLNISLWPSIYLEVHSGCVHFKSFRE